MFFTANDSIKLNMSRDDAIKLFEKTFYDMHKAGYTLSTRIIHTDYNGKKFTGFIDDSGKYIAGISAMLKTTDITALPR